MNTGIDVISTYLRKMSKLKMELQNTKQREETVNTQYQGAEIRKSKLYRLLYNYVLGVDWRIIELLA